MEQITRSEYLARLNIQENELNKRINATRQDLIALIESRNEVFSTRTSLEQLEWDGMNVAFYGDDEGLSFHARAKPEAGFPTSST